MLSVIIPSRNGQPYLQKTIDDLLKKAKGKIEVIVVLDGYWPDPQIKSDPRVVVIHHGTLGNNFGMRDSINAGMAIARGTHVMKTDEHCMFDKGFDLKLKADCKDNWVVIPRRYRLDPDEWKIIEDGRPPVDYAFIAYPYERPRHRVCGLHGGEWKQRHFDRKDILIDGTMSTQGSCYFMKKSFWDSTIGPLNSKDYGSFTHEPQEVCQKAWFSGGKTMVNKKTWYAHMHKGKRGKGYGFTGEQYKIHGRGNEKGRLFCIDFWINNKWKDRKHDWDWFLKQFWPVPSWPDDWKDRLAYDKNRERFIKNRLDFAKYLNELGFKKGAEIGVHRGYYSKVLCQAIPNLELICIDWWRGRTEYLHKQAQEKLAPFNTTLIKKTSMEALADVPDNSLDFVYIDANHRYAHVLQDIKAWTKKVRIGGIVSGHDYWKFPGSGYKGAKKAVDEYVNDRRIPLSVIPADKSIRKDDDKPPNWFFFKLREYK